MRSISKGTGCSTKEDRQLRIEFPTPIEPHPSPLYFSYFIPTVHGLPKLLMPPPCIIPNPVFYLLIQTRHIRAK
jgi:hypothetical protein